MTPEAILNTILEEAKRARITDDNLAKSAGLGRSTFYYHKKNRSFSLDHVVKMADRVGVLVVLVPGRYFKGRLKQDQGVDAAGFFGADPRPKNRS